MKGITSFLLWTLFLISSYSQGEALWLRYTAISPDGGRIAFTYKGDIYVVPVTGGTPVPVTFYEAYDFMPVWSKDGKQIAFASDRYSNLDVFIVPAEGWLGNVAGWVDYVGSDTCKYKGYKRELARKC